MRSVPPDGQPEDLGHFLVAPAPSRPGPGGPRADPAEAARAAHLLAAEAARASGTLAVEAARAALMLATEAERSAVEATRSADRSADRVRVEARAGRRRLWQALLVLAALALAALVLAAARHHPGGLP